MPSPQEIEMASALSPEDKKRVGAMIRAGRKPSEALRSVVDQNDAYEREQPTTREKVAAAATGAANSLAPSPAIMSASPLGAIGGAHMKALRMVTGADEGAEAAAEAAPGAFGSGALAGDALGAVLGPGGAGAGKTASGAAEAAGGAIASGAVKAAQKPIAKRAVAAAADAGSEAAKRIPFVSSLRKLLGRGGEVTDDMIVAADDIPKATEGLTPELSKADLESMLARLKPKAKPADDIDYAKEADGFDPGGESFMAWLKQQTPPSAARAVETGKAQVAGTKVDRTPAKGGDLRAEAVERITKEDVGADVAKTPPGPSAKPMDGNAFLEQEAAAATEAAGRAWKSLPLSPVGQPKPGPLSTSALRAEARAAVARGESLVDLAARLGLNKTDRELVAVFKAAQIGN